MSPDQARAFLMALGGKPEPYHGEGWLKCSCPLAPWTHQHGKDANPSFGLKVGDKTESKYNCFSCESGSAEDLLGRVEHYVRTTFPHIPPKYDFALARKLLEQEAVDVFPLPEFSEFDAPLQEFQEWPQWFLDSFPSALLFKDATQYLTNRGLSLGEIKDLGLRWDAYRKCVGFPFRNAFGKLGGMRGRGINPEGLQHHDYTWNNVNNTGLVWYHEEALTTEEPVLIVEGQFDFVRAARVYPHTMANLTAKPSLPKLKKLVQCPGVILMLDNDKTGDAATLKYLEFLDKHDVNVAVVELPKEHDADGKLIKRDPDNMGEDWIRDQLIDLVPCK